MFQSNHLQAFNWTPSHSGSGLAKQQRTLQIVPTSQSAKNIEALRRYIPAEASPNKKAIMERLISLYAENAPS